MFHKILLFLFSSFTLVFAVQTEEISTAKPTRIYVDVVADLMHAGHIEFFKKAKALGDYLIVGVLSDSDVASYKRVPILTLSERVAEVQACRYVDEVIAAPPMRVTKEWLKEHQIDLVVHGDDYDEKTMTWWYGVPIQMGIFRTLPYTKGISTTNIIKRITDRYLEDRLQLAKQP
ncbi:MAG: adenylyltransferase/cytidyltransferase family protein [Rhabdochlamydiaceae bacterium]|jgi:cytidyltransferase-like protein